MKKELLRINRLNYNYTRTRKLENVSFCILEGECIGFLGLSYSGKDLMTSLLRGELTEGDGSGAIYLGGQKVNDWEVLGKEIYYMCPDNYVIEDWTVAEYLCLVDSGWAGSFWRKGVLNEEAGKYFEELELDFDISSRIRDLSELEKRIVDVVKAYRKGARIIIIEDEFDGVSQTDIIKFGKIIRRLIQRKLGVIVNSNSNFIMSELSDKFIIFDRGHVVKKCAREYIKNEKQLECFLLGENVLPSREKIEERTEMSWKEEDIVYRIRNLKIFQDDVKNLNFVRGEVVTLLTLNRRKKELLFLILSGRINVENVHYILTLLCIGETAEEKDFGISAEVLRTQLKIGFHDVPVSQVPNIWVAYEPVWSIGVNGTPASADYAEKMHKVIKACLREIFGDVADEIPVLYGGSVNPGNANELIVQPSIDGLFTGRAAWQADNFDKLIRDAKATYEAK